MEIVKETEDYQIVKKRSGRYGIRKRDRSWITGDEKVKILAAEGLIKLSEPAKEPEPEPEPQPEPEEAAASDVEPDGGEDGGAGGDEDEPPESDETDS